jgi:hypothetical protein
LLERYDVELSPDPQVVFFSSFGDMKVRSRLVAKLPGLKVFYTGENVSPDFDQCDLALSFSRLNDTRNYRLPLWALADGPTSLLHVQAAGATLHDLVRSPSFDAEKLMREKTRFCNFVYSARAPERLQFLNALMRVRHVDCAGKVCHNLGTRGLARDGKAKLALQRESRFSIAFENTSSPGYVTEKIMHPLLAGSVPIYWGAPDVVQDFNPRCFVNCHDFNTLSDVVDYVVGMDDTRYLEYLSAPPFRGNTVPKWAHRLSVLDWLAPFLEELI